MIMNPKKIKKNLQSKSAAATKLRAQAVDLVNAENYKAAAISFYGSLKLHATSYAYYGLSYCLKNLGQCQEALHCLDEAMKDPRYQNDEVYITAGHMARDAGLSKAAVKYYEQAGTKSPALSLYLGDAYAGTGDFDTAEAHLLDAKKDVDLSVMAERSLAIIELKRGNYELAETMLSTLYERDPSAVGLAFADVLLARGRFERSAEVAEGVLKDAKSDVTKRKAHFFLGSAYEKLGQYKKSWKHFVKGNKLKNMIYRPEDMERNVNKTIRQWPHRRKTQRLAFDTITPVFIVGMPRSGTSLVEQIFGRHSRIHAAGEIDLITDKKDPGEYLEKIDMMTNGEQFITNKNPYNFIYLGQIDQKFDAKIIHIQRDINDNILSIFQQDFANHHPYAYNVDNIVHYYQQYQKLMWHWESIGIPMLTIDYENLVIDPDTEVQRMLYFLGLNFEYGCLHPEESERIVKTASIHQVRKPINTSSIGRWENYKEWL